MEEKLIEGHVNFRNIYRPNITLDHMTKSWIVVAMKHYNNNITACAESLGISRATLYRKMEEIKDNVRK